MTVKNETLSEISTQANDIFNEVSNKGAGTIEPKEIVSNTRKLLAILDKLQPHINKAETAFGGQKDTISKANELRNKLNRIITTYSS